jgi:general secretion pathway protein B
MSYILDALRRADAERERGEVPSLHTQQYGALPGDDVDPGRPLLLIGTIVFLALALAGALGWHFWGSGDASTRVAAQGAVSALPVPSAALPAAGMAASAAANPAAIQAPPLPLPAASAAPAAAPSASSSPTPSIATSRESKRHVAAAALRASAHDARRPGTARTASTSASSGPAGNGTAALPDALRRELPALAFGGASYSKDAASRMVIFNGRVFHEGDTLAPELVLEQIKLKAAVLTYKGYRYELAF